MNEPTLTLIDYYRLNIVERAEIDAWLKKQPADVREFCTEFTLHADGSVSFTVQDWPREGTRVVKVDKVACACPWPFPDEAA